MLTATPFSVCEPAHQVAFSLSAAALLAERGRMPRGRRVPVKARHQWPMLTDAERAFRCDAQEAA